MPPLQTIAQRLGELSNDYSPAQARYEHVTGAPLIADPLSRPPLLSSYRSVSVVIPAWNAAATLPSCLVAIEQSSFNRTHPHRLQVVVVDDGSTDSTWDLLCSIDLDLSLIAIRQPHRERGQAMNAGISVADGEIIISCDADMVLDHHTIEHMVVRHSVLDDVLLIGFRAGVPPSDPRLTIDALRSHPLIVGSEIRGDVRIHDEFGWPRSVCSETDHLRRLGCGIQLMTCKGKLWDAACVVYGTLFSLPRTDILAVGGYDERFTGWGGEDTHLVAKTVAAGNQVVPVYGASGLHIDHPRRSPTFITDQVRNRALYATLVKETQVDDYLDAVSTAARNIVKIRARDRVHRTTRGDSVLSRNDHNDDPFPYADSLMLGGDYDRALPIYTQLALSESNAQAWLRAGQALFALQRYREAIPWFKHASCDGTVGTQARIELALTQACLADFYNARKQLQAVLAEFPDHLEARHWLTSSIQQNIEYGEASGVQGFHQLAARFCEAALIVDPSNVKAREIRRTNLDESMDLTLR